MFFYDYEMSDIMKELDVVSAEVSIYACEDPANLLEFIERAMSRMMGKPVKLDFIRLPDGNRQIVRQNIETGKWGELNIGRFTDYIFVIPFNTIGEEGEGTDWHSFAMWSNDNMENPLLHIPNAMDKIGEIR